MSASFSIDKAREVRAGESLNINQLNNYLKTQNVDIEEVVEVFQFPGGYSNLTYLLKTATKEYILRRPPVGAKDIIGGHDMGREYKILKALEDAHFRQIPKPIILVEDEAVLGCTFYIMERVQGVILRAKDATILTENASPTEIRQLSESLCDNLVALHSIDIETTGLIAIGKPEGYIQRQVDGWYKRYQYAQTDEVKAMDELAAWLQANIPAENKPALIHNDYKYDNVVLNPKNLTEILAILDWEMTTVGDPLMDLGTTLSYWAEENDGDFEKGFNLSWVKGNLTRQEFANRYAEKSGRDISNILFYYVFGLFKNAVIIQQIYSRYKKGLTQDPRFASLLFGVKALSKKATKSVETNEMK